MKDVYIIEAVRTPVGKAPRGVFRKVLPDDLLVHVLKALVERHEGVDWSLLGDVVVGCAMPEAEQGMNVARIATLRAGLPQEVPAMTINRFCSSGVQSIAIAQHAIQCGGMEMAIAGGVESMSQVPLGGNKYTVNPAIFKNEDVAIAYGMGITAEVVAKKYNITREQQDSFALRSHQHALAAEKRGDFVGEIVPYLVRQQSVDLRLDELVVSERLIKNDEGPRADTSLEALERLPPVFAKNGTVTAGNSSQMSDGASALLLASEQAISRYGLKPKARLIGYAVAGVAPQEMGIGPVAAVPRALKQAGIKVSDLDWIELNEAFAAQALAVIAELDLPLEKVNPLGGAIALGHPLGATGAIKTTTLLHGLQRTQGKYGMVTMCIGTGMGAAAIFERV